MGSLLTEQGLKPKQRGDSGQGHGNFLELPSPLPSQVTSLRSLLQSPNPRLCPVSCRELSARSEGQKRPSCSSNRTCVMQAIEFYPEIPAPAQRHHGLQAPSSLVPKAGRTVSLALSGDPSQGSLQGRAWCSLLRGPLRKSWPLPAVVVELPGARAPFLNMLSDCLCRSWTLSWR